MLAINEITSFIVEQITAEAWVSAQIFLLFIGCCFAYYFKNKALKKIRFKLPPKGNIWQEAIISSAHYPTDVMIVLLFISNSVKIIGHLFPSNDIFVDIQSYINNIGVIAVGAWFLLKLTSEIERIYFSKKPQNINIEGSSSFLPGKIVRLSIVILSIIITLETLGYSLTALLTLGSVGSLVVGFAAKDLVSNFFGSVTIHLDKPFEIGDKIKTQTSMLNGMVEKIGWRSTRIRNDDLKSIYVPNNTWLQTAVVNTSQSIPEGIHSISQIIYLRYQDSDKIELIVQDIEKELKLIDEINKEKIMIVLHELGEKSLNLLLKVEVNSTNMKKFSQIKQNILLKVIEIVHRHGADFQVSILPGKI